MPGTLHDIHQTNRREMLDRAKALDWPRVILKRQTTGHTPDKVGPGITAWHLLAEQMPLTVIDDAIDALRRPPTADTTELYPTSATLTMDDTATGDEGDGDA